MARKLNTPKTDQQAAKAPAKAVAVKRHKKATTAMAETEMISTPAPTTETTVLETTAAPVTVREIALDPQEVSRLAHSYWVARNFQSGSQLDDWFRAENELRARAATR